MFKQESGRTAFQVAFKEHAPSNSPHESRCALLSSTQTVRKARFRTRTACSHGDVETGRPSYDPRDLLKLNCCTINF
jgi:hypothetical protein